MRVDGGAITPGELTGVSGCCRLRINGAAATFLFTLERPWRGAMKPRKRSGSRQQGTAEFPGIVETDPIWIRTSKQVVAGGKLDLIASAQTRRQVGRGQGLKILAREAIHHFGTKNADFPDRLVMGLHDASSGACGDFCLCERNCVFARIISAASRSSGPTLPHVRRH